MIALFVTDDIPTHLVARHLFNVRRQVNGPFLTWEGETRAGRHVRAYRLAPRTEDAYVAGRLACRWGADLLLHLGLAWGARRWIEATSMAPGDIVLCSSVYNLRALEPLQRLLPDTADRLPVAWPEGVPGPPIETTGVSGAGAPLGTLALALTVGSLSDHLHAKFGIGLFDTAAAGLAEAAAEESRAASIAVILRGAVRPAATPAARGFPGENELAESVGRFMQEAGLDPTPSEEVRRRTGAGAGKTGVVGPGSAGRT